jgi:RNA polymerase sigma-70 factor (ECF subfamily)
MDDMADGELIRRISGGAGEGRPAAEAELCRRFAPRIRLYGLKHLRDEDRARDLVQAVLLAVLTAAREGRIADPDRADRFMLGTCRNMALKLREAEARNVGDEALAHLPAPMEDGAPITLDFTALIPCLGRLDQRARQVVSLSFLEQHPTEVVATRVGITAGNVRVVRHRAIASLRRCLDQEQRA